VAARNGENPTHTKVEMVPFYSSRSTSTTIVPLNIQLHCVHENTAPLYTLPYLWQTTSDFNEILRQHCDIKLQTRPNFSKIGQHLQQLQKV